MVDGFTNATGVMKRYAHIAGNNTGNTAPVDRGFIVFPEKTLILGKTAISSGNTPVILSMECLLINQTWADTAQDIF